MAAIQPGKPLQNAYDERYSRTVRHEWLGQYNFSKINDVQDYATQWLCRYNNERSNMGIGGITPAQKSNLQMKQQIVTKVLHQTPFIFRGITPKEIINRESLIRLLNCHQFLVEHDIVCPGRRTGQKNNDLPSSSGVNLNGICKNHNWNEGHPLKDLVIHFNHSLNRSKTSHEAHWSVQKMRFVYDEQHSFDCLL